MTREGQPSQSQRSKSSRTCEVAPFHNSASQWQIMGRTTAANGKRRGSGLVDAQRSRIRMLLCVRSTGNGYLNSYLTASLPYLRQGSFQGPCYVSNLGTYWQKASANLKRLSRNGYLHSFSAYYPVLPSLPCIPPKIKSSRADVTYPVWVLTKGSANQEAVSIGRCPLSLRSKALALLSGLMHWHVQWQHPGTRNLEKRRLDSEHVLDILRCLLSLRSKALFSPS